MANMEKMLLGKIEEVKLELESHKTAARDTEKMLMQEVKTGKEEKMKVVAELEEKIEQGNTELTEIREARDTLNQEKNTLEAVQDGQMSAIERLETELTRAKEDVECRKLIIDEMSKSMLGHEHESMEMAQKLTLMKN